MTGGRNRPPPPKLRPGYWFRPKRFGYGAVPATWQGWAATAAMVIASLLVAGLAEHRGMVFMTLLIPIVTGFVWLCWSRTDGEWRWRSGDD